MWTTHSVMLNVAFESKHSHSALHYCLSIPVYNTHACTHARTRAHARAHTHTQTHTHTPSNVSNFQSNKGIHWTHKPWLLLEVQREWTSLAWRYGTRLVGRWTDGLSLLWLSLLLKGSTGNKSNSSSTLCSTSLVFLKPFSMISWKVVIYGHCLVTLPRTMNKRWRKWLTPVPILMQNHSDNLNFPKGTNEVFEREKKRGKKALTKVPHSPPKQQQQTTTNNNKQQQKD